MNSASEKTDVNMQCQVSSPSATSTIMTTSTATAAFSATSLFNVPGINTHGFPLPDPNQANIHGAQQNITGVPTQPPSVQATYPPYMNYVYPPFNNMPTISSGTFPFDSFHGQYQPPSSRLQLLAPKPPPDAHVNSAGAGQAQPPSFLETVKDIRRQLFEMGGLSASDEPLTEGSIYSKWQKAVISTWKPVSLFIDFIFKENPAVEDEEICRCSQAVVCNLFPFLLPFCRGRVGEKINNKCPKRQIQFRSSTIFFCSQWQATFRDVFIKACLFAVSVKSPDYLC